MMSCFASVMVIRSSVIAPGESVWFVIRKILIVPGERRQGSSSDSKSVAGSPAHSAFTSAPAETAAVIEIKFQVLVRTTMLSRLAAVESTMRGAEKVKMAA